MASANVGRWRSLSLSVLLLEKMHENLLAAGLEEYAEGICGLLKVKEDHIPADVLIHLN